VSRRAALFLCLTLATLLVVARTAPFMAPGVRFDADQALAGLMAKHISEGRAFPVFFYGQKSQRGHLAAPVVAISRRSGAELPLLVMNAATVLLAAERTSASRRGWRSPASPMPFPPSRRIAAADAM
jgi:hypothetical protein